MRQPQRIKSMTRVPVKDAPAIELTETEEQFCRKYNYWPNKLELKMSSNAPESDREIARGLAVKIKHLRIIHES
jgi:hypothetical protein